MGNERIRFIMENKLINAKASIYLVLGSLCFVLQLFINRMSAFEDQSFICGILVGASIVFLLHAVWFMGKNIGKFRAENKEK